MADDLVDEPPEGLDTMAWIIRLAGHLDLIYKPKKSTMLAIQGSNVRDYIDSGFPASARSALSLLPTLLIPSEPQYSLFEGFKTDSKFRPMEQGRHFPIVNEDDLRLYASQVASTIGELCLSLITHHSSIQLGPEVLREVTIAAKNMGMELQFVNIARDIAVDAMLGRV